MEGKQRRDDTKKKTPQTKKQDTYRTRNNRPIPLPNLHPPISIRIVYRFRFRGAAGAGSAGSGALSVRRVLRRWIRRIGI